ncbi:XRE family transcriptional regulator [Actinomadura sp. DC4]|uniref:XRE family transcriptional regulator n=1 Tax=Actinomadura sp. DC4 TaxID=3055069 RepID=UPI0025B04F90|nr:XRE family transcriptional regulator [Actinomadura sp. DC4]MDN3357471.1 XRE family transcriptional regulator [Actinomadura sp. DC4]
MPDPSETDPSRNDTEPPRKEAELARVIRARGLAQGHTPPEIAKDIHDGCAPIHGTTRIKAHRLAHGIALSDVVAQVRALYELDGRPLPKLGETLLSAYESGYKRPGPAYQHDLCRVYRVEPADLGLPGPCVCGRSHGLPRGGVSVVSPREPDVVLRPGVPLTDNARRPPFSASHISGVQYRAEDLRGGAGEEEETVLRRTLLQILAGAGVALDGQILGAVDGVRRRMDDTLVTASVSPTMLDQWEETALGYGKQYTSTPPLRLLCDVLLDFSEVRRMCEQRQPIELQERLCRLAAQLSGLAGAIMINLGDHRLSRSFFRTARTAADETGDRGLRSWVSVREALVPMYYGDPRESLHLARRAQDLAGRTPSAAAAMAPIVEARALGMLVKRGRTDAASSAKRAIARGQAVFSQLSKDHVADTAFGYTERQLAFHIGDTLTNMGDHTHADESLRRALTLYPPSSELDRTLISLDRSWCRLQKGAPDEALDTARQTVLALSPGQFTDIIAQRARQLIGAAVAEYGEITAAAELREVLATPVKAVDEKQT